MRKKERLLWVALFALAFLLFVPALVEGPSDTAAPVMERPLAAAFFSTSRLMERPTGDQGAPLRVDRPEGIAITDCRMLIRPDVKADANGHPLGESTYIKAVYQAFRLEDKSG